MGNTISSTISTLSALSVIMCTQSKVYNFQQEQQAGCAPDQRFQVSWFQHAVCKANYGKKYRCNKNTNQCVELGTGGDGDYCEKDSFCQENYGCDLNSNSCTLLNGSPCATSGQYKQFKSNNLAPLFCKPDSKLWEAVVTNGKFGSFCDNKRYFCAYGVGGSCISNQCSIIGMMKPMYDIGDQSYHHQMQQRIRIVERINTNETPHRWYYHGEQQTGEYCNHNNFCASSSCNLQARICN